MEGREGEYDLWEYYKGILFYCFLISWYIIFIEVLREIGNVRVQEKEYMNVTYIYGKITFYWVII